MSLFPACSVWQAAVWEQPVPDGPSKVQHTSTTLSHRSRDAISLSVEFRHVSAETLDQRTWNQIDETAFPSEVRKAWLDNGLRIGLLTIAGQELLQKQIAGSHQGKQGGNSDVAEDPINALLAVAEVLGKQADGREIVPLRPAHRHELPMSPPIEGEQTVLLKRSTGLIGQRFQSPQLVLALTARLGPREGQATLDIRPEIHHGAVRQQFVSSETAVRMHAGREHWELPEMNLSWTTQAGATLLIAPAIDDVVGEPTFGLGRQMLRDDQHMEDDQHLIALIQLKP
ncbi:hypothetical protein [Neorhodopirellula pilleata]|nr:hypothetical protein [Neorhodopirellula pilleata]